MDWMYLIEATHTRLVDLLDQFERNALHGFDTVDPAAMAASLRILVVNLEAVLDELQEE